VGTRRKPSAEELKLAAVSWYKASRSNNEGACVRVGRHAAHILIDDSKNPGPTSGNALVLTSGEFTAFLHAVR
jgi:hypothetical protein